MATVLLPSREENGIRDVGPMEEKTRIRIGGIKFSEELAHVTAAFPSAETASFDRLLHLLADRHINLPFIYHSRQDNRAAISFCVLQEDLERVKEILKDASFAEAILRIIPSVGTLTVFPHRNSFQLLGLILQTFAANGYPIFSFGTSISAIAINTRFLLLDEVAGKLADVVSLPDNHAPFRQEFRLTQLY